MIDEFRRVDSSVDPTGTGLRWTIGNALEVLADDSSFDDIGGCGMVTGLRWPGGDHLGLPVESDGYRIGVELAVAGELLLGEPERGVEQLVEVALCLRGCGVPP
jgi:hypothetical protein